MPSSSSLAPPSSRPWATVVCVVCSCVVGLVVVVVGSKLMLLSPLKSSHSCAAFRNTCSHTHVGFVCWRPRFDTSRSITAPDTLTLFRVGGGQFFPLAQGHNSQGWSWVFFRWCELECGVVPVEDEECTSSVVRGGLSPKLAHTEKNKTMHDWQVLV